ncbi:MAG: peptide-methionine (S)-S-oxide reductase [Candidatus Blackburnbacteria bacterium RIFCSPHIGHO2_02_FULL_39_13]|uniref:Peptide methionine sulfoxide reductase MsrA n=1 Tax=Candidatus Blackburnbacteria bacterium RIFCSPLOWO2_01_FULL_40_20 TaxID=1797519 RepID=A0A1G1VBD2_9BACT|nr:MAG: peptide-methionine (S)-S-oxide reductase [Candidatus Blackburnbacteria bacterium RIFCSPHIGHO2_01_FULL_40_17]OGY08934.1 MAG: peptide-methionine (S)-S-oxide reductase [Candidatus Blackburnbacteria bacterium RIFCSPHIGHO2_02_FULL_39_13]OGY12720.1 MAG: peptide-methionine (S)-S-oxide reductase [Candidatus Blackburnbacteria bacterium RIFCSPLOWO2_01_FULL_40_20]
MEKVTLAGGCFWCTGAVFKRLRGVISVIPGYSGGTKTSPTYEEVSNGMTVHAESIQITFDPKIINFEKLLEVFWKLHDPTTLNCQGTDIGTQYRSAIFYETEKQREIAEKSKKEAQKDFADPIVTEITLFTAFYPAEAYHENYYSRNRESLYCRIVIDPKLQKLMKEFKKEVK